MRARPGHVAVAAAIAGTVALSPAVSTSAPAAPCTDVSNPAGPPIVDDSSTATFGPLAATPILDLTITPPTTLVEGRSVPGGVVITTLETPFEAAPADAVSAVSFVEYSGALRWRRCAPATYLSALAAPAAAGGGAVLLVEYPSAGDDPQVFRALDLTTGTEVALPAGITAETELWQWSDAHALLGPSTQGIELPLGPGDSFVLVDLATMTSTTVPAPPGMEAAQFPAFAIGDTGAVGLIPDGTTGPVTAAFVGGAWTTDTAVVDANLPLYTGYDPTAPIAFHRASGAVAWTLPDLTDPNDEGFRWAATGDVVLVRGCTTPAELGCDPAGFVLVGVDSASGTERWRLDGSRYVFAAGDGYALITGEHTGGGEPVDQTLIDAATATPVAGQRWPDGTFVSGCCGDTSFTRRDGGIVLTGHPGGLRAFLPRT